MARKAANKPPVTKPEKEPKKAFPLIARTDLRALLAQAAIHQNRASTAQGLLRELIAGYVAKKRLHAGAFRIINRWRRLGERDPQALWLELAHVDDMREKAGLDKLAKAQGQLLPAIGEDDVQVNSASEQPETQPETRETPPWEDEAENVVQYEPRAVDEKAGAA